jgi:hypothetical protein
MDTIGNGVMRDESSRTTRFDLLPPEAIIALAEVFYFPGYALDGSRHNR